MSEAVADAGHQGHWLVPEARDDPWRWYCWHCTAVGDADERAARDALGLAHVRDVHRSRVESDTYGRLMHVGPVLPVGAEGPPG